MPASDYPLLIISHNNHAYVNATIKQAVKFGLTPTVLDNASSYANTIDYLNSAAACGITIKHLGQNFGHMCWAQPEIYDQLPNRFFITDPDLEWNVNLPSDFPKVLDDLCTLFEASKVGFALDISDSANMFQDADYCPEGSIDTLERRFWDSPIAHNLYVLYEAPIDTTFCLFNKLTAQGPHGAYAPTGRKIRVGGNFTAKHLPWYRKTNVPPHDLAHMYMDACNSTTAKLVLREMACMRVQWDPCDDCRQLHEILRGPCTIAQTEDRRVVVRKAVELKLVARMDVREDENGAPK